MSCAECDLDVCDVLVFTFQQVSVVGFGIGGFVFSCDG